MLIKEAQFVRGAASWNGLADDGLPEIAFIGRSNVGKSSLINMLVGRKSLARTSNTPGKTQQFNYYLINNAFYFVDLPGFGYAKVSKAQRAKWERFISRYLSEHEPLRLVIHLVDSRHDPTSLDKDVMEFMKGGWMTYVVVLTKMDKLSGNQRGKAKSKVKKALAAFNLEVPVIASSSKNKTGKDEILQWIQDVGL